MPLHRTYAFRTSAVKRDNDFDWNSKNPTNFAKLAPSTSINWTPCFKNFTCMNLEVPLDYGNSSSGTIAIAFIKLAAQNISENTQDILINPGGPGGSGVELVQVFGSVWQEVIGTEHNIIGFDPRGVGNSGPIVDCFPGHPEARAHFESIFYPDVSNASSTSVDTQFYAAHLFGTWCNENAGNASFISTPAVARDMLTYIMAEQKAANKSVEEAKLSYYGTSYGSALGVTFASLFPDKVRRVVVDGVIDTEDYYNLGWRDNLYQADEALQSFSSYCFQGGESNCSFWGPSAQNISNRLHKIVADLKYHPIPVAHSEACPLPMLATYSDLKQLMIEAMYNSLSGFPLLSDLLVALEQRNGSAVIAAVTQWSIPANPCNNGTVGNTVDSGTLIKCVDGWNGTHFKTIEEYQGYVDTLMNQSKFFGEVWPNNANGVSCRSFEMQPPESGMLPGSIMQTKNTSFPLLFISMTDDPVAPIRGAYKMSAVFPGSIVLAQKGVSVSLKSSQYPVI
ncbi:hypothetical protein AOQ84DRAFT_395589 [Glonium stellatum]|uniref:AB hydrolase-1 domain-containing protein n=1 Tax=Glonium stellatum TaxID=574774 RepID=A0A8E2F8V3_9PEZI|nr:hypothetical protein AOQ84DRAFT_395589 [Glonium stellatum]